MRRWSASLRPGWDRTTYALACLVGWLVLLCLVVPARASERQMRVFGPGDGLDADSFGEIVQDGLGYIWISSKVGVYRFDGRRFERAAPDQGPYEASDLAVDPAGGVYVLRRNSGLVHTDLQHRTEIPLPPDYVDNWVDVGVDDLGQPWLVSAGRAWVRRSGSWIRLEAPLRPGERVLKARDARGRLVLVTNHGVLEVVGDQVLRRAWREAVANHVDALWGPSGALYTLTWHGELERWSDDGTSAAVLPRGYRGFARGIALGVEGDSLWVALSDNVVRYQGDRVMDGITLHEAPNLLVDHEGSLWLASPASLTLCPQPATERFDTRDGMASNGVLRLSLHGDQVWATSWSELSWLEGGVGHRVANVRGTRPACFDGAGQLVRPYNTGRVLWWRDGRSIHETVAPTPGMGGCVGDEDGSVWLGFEDRLAQAWPDGTLTWLPPAPVPARDLWRHGDRLALARGETLCEATRDEARRGAWSCLDLSPLQPRALAAWLPVTATRRWIATEGAGLLEIEGVRVERIESVAPTTAHVLGLYPASSGGAWVVGASLVARLDTDEGHVLETLSVAQGVMRSSASDVVEDEQGVVWLASAMGVVRVPPEARLDHRAAPTVRLAGLRRDGESLDPARLGDDLLRIPAAPNHLALDFAALTFRDTGAVRYRVQLDEGPVRPFSTGLIQLVDQPSGPHTVRAWASLDGQAWSDPVELHVLVATPWWRQPGVWLLGLVLLALLVAGALRARLLILVAREQERTRIAMDLHDELGSGLGSIGLLAGVLGSARIPDDQRGPLADRIRATAAELGEAVQQLTGTLRAGGTGVDALVGRLGQRLRDLFPDGSVSTSLVVPDPLPAGRLALDVRLELERLVAEALHNVAKHAQASHVEVGLACDSSRWRLWVRDDGVGFDPDAGRAGEGAGLGLASQRARAARIGADLQVVSQPGHGTTVTVTLPPRSRGR